MVSLPLVSARANDWSTISLSFSSIATSPTPVFRLTVPKPLGPQSQPLGGDPAVSLKVCAG
jgi:hypothetical protein